MTTVLAHAIPSARMLDLLAGIVVGAILMMLSIRSERKRRQ